MGTLIPQEIADRHTTHEREQAAAIRDWCKQNVALWQQVPYLALRADGRSGWSDNYSRAYHWGLWTLSIVQYGYYSFFVDCATGEVVASPERLNPVSDDRLLTIPLTELDAEQVVARLKRASHENHWPSTKEATIVHRRKLMKQLGLGRDVPYTRTRQNVVVEEYM